MAEGQAMFQVQGDTERPFDVLTGDVRVTVVGTRFSVRHTPSTPGYPGVQVGVAAGHVRVGPGHPAAWWEFWRPDRDRYATDLTAGQQVTVGESGQPGRVARIDASDVAPWLEHRVAFDNATLAQAIAEFGRYGHPAPTLADARVGSLRLTGSFDTRNLA
ncbi:MAG: Fe2+-dicitrate sensor protein, partial [Starkeya sp.]|nr:Fe2+-dicitrate sensor protein [Starkeya sp.]